MTTDIQPLEGALDTFIANTEYGIWRYRRSDGRHYPFGYRIDPGMTLGELSDRQRKERVVEKMEDLSYPGLVNSHLFPHYDEYENAISGYLDSIRNTMWSDPIMIPKSRSCPEGGNYLRADINLPADLFDDIPDRFFDRFECSMLVISSWEWHDMFWQNLDIRFSRKETLLSWDGERFGKISGNVTVVVPDGGKEAGGAIIPAMMSILLQAWTECRCLRDSPAYRWAGPELGKGRYRKNIDTLMTGSGNACLSDMGLFLKGVREVNLLMKDPERASHTEEEAECGSMPPISAVKHVSDIMKKSEGYMRLHEMEELLGRICSSLDGQDPKAVCETWNRCVKQKVRSVDELRALLLSKYLGVRNDILTVLSMRPVFHFKSEIFYF